MLTIQSQIKKHANLKKAEFLAHYFKTGKGEYGEGDIFLGLTVPKVREIAKKYASTLTLKHTEMLLRSKIHEERLAALVILGDRFKKGDTKTKERIYRLYLQNTKYVNNWDLVDASAEHIIGAFLDGKPKNVLKQLARSKSLWERRIAIIATFHYIKQHNYKHTFAISKLLLSDKHDLIHKAVGWMLREVGNYCRADVLEQFLKQHYTKLPRTTLRYAIERFGTKKRKSYLYIAKK